MVLQSILIKLLVAIKEEWEAQWWVGRKWERSPRGVWLLISILRWMQGLNGHVDHRAPRQGLELPLLHQHLKKGS